MWIMLMDRKHPILKMNRRVSLQDLNPHLMCVLCGGYYVDATTIIECVHSFCRSCIVKHLESSKYCPICEVMVHKTKPLMNIRRDKTLQDIVYKLVPGLFAREMRERRQFYRDRPHYVKPDDVESGGEVSDERKSYICDDSITVSLSDSAVDHPPWFLRCPVGVTIKHFKKLVLAKYGFRRSKVHVEVMLKNQVLDDDLTLLDISCLYPWRSKDTLDLTYSMLAVNEKKENPENSEESKPVPAEVEKEKVETDKPSEEVVEKEIQLQITESGVMSMSEIDTRQVGQSLDQIIGYSLPELPTPSQIGSSLEPVPIVPLEPKKVVLEKDTRPKRPAAESEVMGVKPKRPSFSREELSSRKTEEKITPNHSNCLSLNNVNAAVCNNSNRGVGLPRSSQSDRVSGESSKSASNNNNSSVSSSKRKESTEARQKAQTNSSNQDGRSSVVPATSSPKDGHFEVPVKPSTPRESGQNVVAPDTSGPKNGDRTDVVVEKPAERDGASSAKPSDYSPHPGSAHAEQKPNKHKAIRSTPHPWRPVITKEKLRPTLMTNSDEPRKPGKFFKMRNMPRFLGNPASGVKPLYSNGLPPPSPPSPSRKMDQIVRIDPKTLRPIQKEEKKAPNTLLTSPFIPRDNRFQLPDPKTQPYSKMNFPPGFHASLPPSVSLLMNPHQHFRNLKAREEAAAAKNCDSPESRSSASATKPAEPEQAPAPAPTTSAATEPPAKCL